MDSWDCKCDTLCYDDPKSICCLIQEALDIARNVRGKLLELITDVKSDDIKKEIRKIIEELEYMIPLINRAECLYDGEFDCTGRLEFVLAKEGGITALRTLRFLLCNIDTCDDVKDVLAGVLDILCRYTIDNLSIQNLACTPEVESGCKRRQSCYSYGYYSNSSYGYSGYGKCDSNNAEICRILGDAIASARGVRRSTDVLLDNIDLNKYNEICDNTLEIIARDLARVKNETQYVISQLGRTKLECPEIFVKVSLIRANRISALMLRVVENFNTKLDNCELLELIAGLHEYSHILNGFLDRAFFGIGCECVPCTQDDKKYCGGWQ